jgi:hypothetical protein
MNPSASVSVYVLRERLHESWEKRESLRMQEEEILRGVVAGSPLENSRESLYEKAIDAVIAGTEGYDNLQSWRTRFLEKSN